MDDCGGDLTFARLKHPNKERKKIRRPIGIAAAADSSRVIFNNLRLWIGESQRRLLNKLTLKAENVRETVLRLLYLFFACHICPKVPPFPKKSETFFWQFSLVLEVKVCLPRCLSISFLVGNNFRRELCLRRRRTKKVMSSLPVFPHITRDKKEAENTPDGITVGGRRQWQH